MPNAGDASRFRLVTPATAAATWGATRAPLPQKAAERAAAVLRDDIIDGTLAAGTSLTESEQAARLGVSRTPVREAFARLIADGLVVERGPRTLIVSRIDSDDVTALFELRRALDEQAARLVAQRADDSQRRRFAELAERFDSVDTARLRADDEGRHGYYSLVADFDAALDAALGYSPYLTSALATVRVHLARVRRLARDDDPRLMASAAEHCAIARAIADADPERAVHATHLHLHNALTSIHHHLKETP